MANLPLSTTCPYCKRPILGDTDTSHDMCKTRIEEREQIERQNVPVTRKEMLEIIESLEISPVFSTIEALEMWRENSTYGKLLKRWKLDKKYL